MILTIRKRITVYQYTLFQEVKDLKESMNKQEELNENKKHNKSGEIRSTPQAPLITSYLAVPLRIKTELMSVRECERLRRITERDTRIIRDYLRIIYHNEETKVLRNGQLQRLINKDFSVNKSVLDMLTLTTFMKGRNKLRTSVPHDMKKRFPRCSVNEFIECRDKAIWIYKSWKKLQRFKTYINKPELKKKIPRPMYLNLTGGCTVRIRSTPNNSKTSLDLEIRDSLDSKRSGKRYHDSLLLPLAYSPYHKKKLEQGKTKMVELFYDSKKKQWYAGLIQQVSVPCYLSSNPTAVLGVDLGIKKTAVAVLLSSNGRVTMDELCFIVNKERQAKIFRIEKRIQSIQKELDLRIRYCQPHNQLRAKLSQLRRQLHTVRKEELGYAVNQLVDFIIQLKKHYNLFVSIGYPKNIRNKHQRGSGRKSLRRKIHKWCYRLFITKLKHKLELQGFESYRVVAVDERYTSKQCPRCLSRKTTRSGQGRFVCNQCNYELNADLNGARNIAKRLIKYVLEPIGDFKKNNVLRDKLSGDFHTLELYECFKPLSQWLKYSIGDISFL